MTKAAPALAPPTQSAPPAEDGRPGPIRRFVRGRAEDPTWVRPGLLGLLSGTALLYLWGLGGGGWANAFYSAAAQAGAQNWKAFFFGSFDAANAITVDKPPAALWVMDLSVRLFGLSSWSLLVPQALMGVATVGVLYLTVRRVVGPGPALIAGAVAALTPVAVLMFRFNNPDALLTLLFTLATYALTRALEKASARWMVLVGVLIGLAFFTKTLQAMLLVPVLALVYLLAAPTTLGKRVLHLLASGAAMVVSGMWWVLVVELVPPSDRPFIGGSQTNSVWELIWGYNGLGRLNGDETGSVTTRPGAGWGATGLLRMFNDQIGGQVAWLLPAALLLLAGGLVVRRRTARTDPQRAALLLWGGWLVLTALTFSLMAGIFHPYYTIVLAPPIGAVVAIGGALVWPYRRLPWARALLAAAMALTAVVAWVILLRSPHFLPWLRWVLALAGVVAIAGLLARRRLGRRALVAVVVAGCLAALGAPTVYAIRTVSSPHVGAIPSAGPSLSTPLVPTPPAPAPPASTAAKLAPMPTGPGGLFAGLPVPVARTMGSLTLASVPSESVTALMKRGASSYTWVAATLGSESASGFQLATGYPVLALGGFNGSDPLPTPAQFQADVAAHRVHWFIGGTGLRLSNGGSTGAHEIANWVETHYQPQIVDGVVLYDVSRPPA